MNSVFNNTTSLLDSLVDYVVAAVNVLVSNKYLMAGSLIMLFTIGKTLQIGKLFKYEAKK